MDQRTRPQEVPHDLEGWRQAINQRLISTFRLEAIVAALQDLGPLADPVVRNPLAKHLSDAMTHLLRKLVGTNHTNQGDDIIYRVHSQLFEALLTPGSADGKGLREAFTARVTFRIKDAIAMENQHSRIPVQAKMNRSIKGQTIDDVDQIGPGQELEVADDDDADDDAGPPRANRDPYLLNGVRDLDQCIDIVRFMKAVPDDRKRLAFYLYMDDVPFGSKRGYSIAAVLGVSAKTAKQWVNEVRAVLQLDSEIQELQKASLGDHT